MSSKRVRLSAFLWVCFAPHLFSRVQEMQQADDVDLAGTQLGGDGIRILTFRCRVKLQDGRPLTGAFYVLADPKTKTYWWAVMPDSGSPNPKRLSWPADFPEYRIQKTPSGFTVFHMSSGKLFIASSRGRFGSDNELATLVRRDFDATAGQHRPKGFAFIDRSFDLHDVLPRSFFVMPLSAYVEQPKLETVARRANGNWELAFSLSVGRIAYLELAPDFSVKGHRIVDR